MTGTTDLNPGLTPGLHWQAPAASDTALALIADLARTFSDVANRHELVLGSQEDFAQTVAMLVRLAPYGDHCAGCSAADAPGDWTRWPIEINVSADGQWIVGRYHCIRCGEDWPCSWAIELPGLPS